MEPRADFVAEMSKPDAMPERLALAIARLAFDSLEPQQYLAQLDEMAETLAPSVQAAQAGALRAQAFLTGINGQLGFHGNQDKYYEANNSYLNMVLERRTGLPILLCVVCMALARRLGLQVEGIGLPGHFVAEYVDPAGRWLLDPFYGALVEPAAASEYLAHLFRRPINLSADSLKPVTPAALALRILSNLRNVYMHEGDAVMSGRVVDHMLAVTPRNSYLWQERGVLAYRSGEYERAQRALRRYFFLVGRLHAAMPQAQEKEIEALPEVDRQLLEILRQVDEAWMRLN